MKKYVYLLPFSLLSTPAFCCLNCNKNVQDGIFNGSFYPNLLTLLSAFFAVGLLVMLLSWIAVKRYKVRLVGNHLLLNPVPLAAAATVLGIGIGGFIDGILLHQILQWHEMISNQVSPVDLASKSINMFWDGIFHAFTLLVVLTGSILLWKVAQRKQVDLSGRLFYGGLMLGWGLFNIVEGVIDHHLLKLHNVREKSPDIDFWNYGFLGISVLMIVIGILCLEKRGAKIAVNERRSSI